MDEKTRDVIQACIDLIKYSVLNGGTGADLDIDFPNGTLHFTYDFTIDLKKENN